MSGGGGRRRRNSNEATPDTANDEELARALQEQYRAEEEYHRAQQGSSSEGNETARETATTATSSRPSRRDAPPQSQDGQSSPRRSTRSNQQRSRDRGATPSTTTRSSRDTGSREGRRSDSRSTTRRPPRSLQQQSQIPENENQPQTETRSAFADSFYGRHKPQTIEETQSTSIPTTTTTATESFDEEAAARLSQELSDEEYAKYLQRCEQARATHLQNSITQPPSLPPQTMEELRAEAAAQEARELRKKRCRRYLPTATFLVMVAIGLTVFFVVYDGNVNNLPDFPDFKDFWPDDDPYQGENDDPSSANKWSVKDSPAGLTLTILNALSNDWTEAFYRAVSDWDNPPQGDKDALTLSTSTTPYESECRPVRGQMKVCNGEYGDTNWRGINEVLIRRGIILSSVAKMNDSYLRRASEDQRQYTMCHEIGHGFGLPHTDEDFYNADLGNCMDYTSNPKNNLRPNTMNFDFLGELYGYSNDVTGGNSDSDVDDFRSVNDTGTRNRRRYSGEPEEKERDVEGEGTRQRKLTSIWNQQDSSSSSKEENINEYEEVSSPEWNEFQSLVELSSKSSNLDFHVSPNNKKRSKWRTLHKRKEGEAHELDLGNGYTYRLSVLH